MNPKTKLLLYQMLWGASQLAHPTFRKLNEGFEAWAYRHGLLRQIQRLEAQGLLESRADSFDESRVHRLTEAGRLLALGGRDPEAAWSTAWDRKWKLFLFDIPESRRVARRKLTRSLTAMGCGCLQKSVWIAAGYPPGIAASFPEDASDCSHLIILDAESCGARADREMVLAAWDFANINSRYRKHLDILDRLPKGTGSGRLASLDRWARNENESWLAAVGADPLLPAVLLPKGYLGRKAWRKRKTVLARATRLANQATPPPA